MLEEQFCRCTRCVAYQAKGSQLSKQHSATASPQPQLQPSAPLPDPKQLDAFAGSLRSARDIDMSLVVSRQMMCRCCPSLSLAEHLCT